MININANKLYERWKYHLEPRMFPLDAANEVIFNGGTAVEDLDLDGDKEIILADVGATIFDDEYPGKVYVFDGGTGKLQTSYNVGNGGTYASVSIANVDDGIFEFNKLKKYEVVENGF